MKYSSGFTAEPLAGTGLNIFRGVLPAWLVPSVEAFERLWAMRPPERSRVLLPDQTEYAPRVHQAYGEDYEFSGIVDRALPAPDSLGPLLGWTRSYVDARLNGILVNWYDAVLRQSIGRHRDSPVRRLKGCPIVTVSLGAPRLFQMYVRRKRLGFMVGNGDVIIIPDEVNSKLAHGVPHRDEDVGRRISITIRGFSDEPSLVHRVRDAQR